MNSRIPALSSTLFPFSLEMSLGGGVVVRVLVSSISFKQVSSLTLRKVEVIRCTKSNMGEDLEARVGWD